MMPLLHITTRAAWDQALAEGAYTTPTLDSEGFIHCSEPHQITRVANERFRGRTGLVLLEIEPARVRAVVRYENTEGGDELFPHIYGPLNLDAVTRVTPFEPGEDGSFSLD